LSRGVILIALLLKKSLTRGKKKIILLMGPGRQMQQGGTWERSEKMGGKEKNSVMIMLL
jgi:hypothetical protein